jgi:beta-lactamase class A
MCSLLKQQQINHKIPFYLQQLPYGPEIAHKTGEDDGITHDGAIIYGKHPFVLVCCGDETDVPAYERAIQDVAKEVYEWNLEGGVTKI